MPYTPDPIDSAQPLDTVEARTAAAEFRSLKDYIQDQVRRLIAASVTTGAVVAADSGKCVYASGGVTLPNSVFAQGDVITIYNNTSGNITLTASVATLRWAGTANTGNRTLAQRGLATVLYISATEAVISGVGLS